MKSIELSVVLCSKSSSSSVIQAVNRLFKLTYHKEWELVIVDCSNKDRRHEIMHSIASGSKSPRVIYRKEKSMQLSRAKNKGWRCSKGEIIIFMEDRHIPQHNYLKDITSIFDENEIVGFVTGTVKTAGEASLFDNNNESDEPIFYPFRSFLDPALIHTVHLSVKRKALKDVGGFDPLFTSDSIGAHGIAEMDIMSRLLFTGWSGFYSPKIVCTDREADLEEVIPSKRKALIESHGAYFTKFLLDKRSRSIFAENYYSRLQSQDFKSKTLLELKGAASYLFQRYIHLPIRNIFTF